MARPHPGKASATDESGTAGATDPPTPGVLTGVLVAHDTASVDETEAADRSDQRATLAALLARDPVDEALVLTTCHRLEAYVVTDTPAAGRRVLAEVTSDVDAEAVVTLEHEESVRHLFQVAAGLESVVLDEDVLDREVERVQERYRRERADEVIAALHERAEAIKTRQVSTALDRFEAGGADRESRRDVVESLADALVANLLAAPTLRLRAAADEGDWSTLETATRLFASGSETEALDTG